MLTVILLLILLGWMAAIVTLAHDRMPWETEDEWRRRRGAEVLRKTIE